MHKHSSLSSAPPHKSSSHSTQRPDLRKRSAIMLKRTLSGSSGTPFFAKRTRTEQSTSAEAKDSHSIDCTTSILSWNVETPVPLLSLPVRRTGSSSQEKARPRHLRELLTRHSFPDFLCLQEVRARQSDSDWIAALKDAANGHMYDNGPRYTAYTSLSRSQRGQRHFGVITFAKDPDKIAAHREVNWDSEGRIVILEMISGWALINVYALNGSENMWKDPSGVSLPKSRNERKREFNRLLLRECQQMQARGLRLVLIGDFNISLTKEDCYPRLRTEYPHSLARKEFNESFIPGANLVDVFRQVHEDRPAFSWFAKGKPQGTDCARVDYALVERTILDRVVETEYLEDPKERAHSDHAPVWLVLHDMDNLTPSTSGHTGVL